MKQLRVPGPTPCPPSVLQALGQQMIDHRGPQFAQLFNHVTQRLKECFLTQGDVFLLTASGTGGMETAIVNTLSPGDKVLAITNGFFGERFAQIAQTYGVEVTRLDFPWGEGADPGEVKAALSRDPAIKAVLLVHNESSTGLTNPLAQLSRVVKEYDKLFLVDAISSLGSLELRTDDWGIDVVVTASQKAWMTPPGLAMVSFSPGAWKAYQQARLPRYYWDLGKAKKFQEKGQTPWTPAVTAIFGLAQALELMAQEGLANIWERHQRLGRQAREGVKSLGFNLFIQEVYASNTVTAVSTPPNLDVKKLVRLLREELGIVLAGGQGKLDGKMFRIGHLGWVNEGDIDEVLSGLKQALPRVGYA